MSNEGARHVQFHPDCSYVFAWPGVGRLMIDSIRAKDTPVVQGGVIFTASIFVFINLLVDILYAYVDPRVKAQYKS